jgi:hypothetical protein
VNEVGEKTKKKRCLFAAPLFCVNRPQAAARRYPASLEAVDVYRLQVFPYIYAVL